MAFASQTCVPEIHYNTWYSCNDFYEAGSKKSLLPCELLRSFYVTICCVLLGVGFSRHRPTNQRTGKTNRCF